MVIQYPHKATVPGKPGNSTLNNDGEWETQNSPSPIVVKGRYEPANVNNEQQLVDGILTKIKGIFYMPSSEPDIDKGIEIIVNDKNDAVILKTKVLSFSRGQLNSRVFL